MKWQGIKSPSLWVSLLPSDCESVISCSSQWIRCHGTTSPQAVSSFPAHVINTPGWWGRRWRHLPVSKVCRGKKTNKQKKPQLRQKLIHMEAVNKLRHIIVSTEKGMENSISYAKSHIFWQVKVWKCHSLQPSDKLQGSVWDNVTFFPIFLFAAGDTAALASRCLLFSASTCSLLGRG